MKKLITKFIIIFTVALVFLGASNYFSSKTKADIVNLQISINSQHPWNETFNWQNFLPGDSKKINLVIKNTGSDTAKIWKRIKNLATEENGIIEPEGEWYDLNHIDRAIGKNDVDSAMIFDMKIDNSIIVNKEANVTMGEVKGAYMYLGQLASGAEMAVEEGYALKSDIGNWMQSDKMTFDIEILALSLDAPAPGAKSVLFVENKRVKTDWSPIDTDGKMGILKYDPIAPAFNYDFLGTGLVPVKEYCLIYYADGWPGNHPGALISSGNTNNQGLLSLSGSNSLGMDLPFLPDANFALGAKIWLVPCDQYNKNSHSIIGWIPNENDWFFERLPEYIRYTRGALPLPIESRTININGLGEDIANQYGYQFDYSNSAVNFMYNTPATGKLSGTLNATGLKPYATYQVKFNGKPVCQYGGAGNDLANEYIGYQGRWWDNTTNSNVNDAYYLANSIYKGGTHCITGYLVWDFFTADSSGNASKAIESANSYHVLFANGGVCNSTDNSHLSYLDPAHPSVLFAAPTDVDGQLERGVCGGMTLNAGDYDLKISLTEESFHQGNWATVLEKDIDFTIK